MNIKCPTERKRPTEQQKHALQKKTFRQNNKKFEKSTELVKCKMKQKHGKKRKMIMWRLELELAMYSHNYNQSTVIRLLVHSGLGSSPV